MQKATIHGRVPSLEIDYDPTQPCRPNPIVTFASFWVQNNLWTPNFGDRNALLLLRRQMPKKVSFQRAYTGWRASGAREANELGEGRAFLRWLQKYELSIDWKKRDFNPHPYFGQKNSPKHAADDEMANGLSFAVKPVRVEGRSVKLYVRDEDMLSLLNMPYGQEEDFLELVMRYVAQRFEWENWRAPAPPFIDWVVSHGKRPVFLQGQLGFHPNFSSIGIESFNP
jgi:hypothetical protein